MYKLIVVDDSPMEGQILKKMLSKTCLPVEYAGQAITGKNGLTLARETHPDIMIVDIKMPEMDGITLSRHIKEYFPRSKVIMLTAHDDFSYIQEALRIGVDDYLLKPVSQDEFELVLERICLDCGELETPSSRQERNATYAIAATVRAGDLQQLRANCDDLFRQWQDKPIEEQEILHLAKTILHDLEETGAAGTVFFHTFIHDICLRQSQAEMLERFYILMETLVKNRHPDEFSSSTDKIMRAKTWIDSHLSGEISLGRLAAEVYLSPTYLSKLFKQVEGTSFSEYVLARRVERAKELLLGTLDSIESVAAQCGYDKPNSFWRIFKQKEGLSPAYYRANNKGG